MKRQLAEYREFFREFRNRFETTGAIAPSGRFLAGALTGPLKQREGPVRVLEVGPGTGAVTRHIVNQLKPGDRFDLVELNDNFVSILRQSFQNDTNYRHAADFSEVHLLPLQEFQTEQPYDYIISGLPLTAFGARQVKDILSTIRLILQPGGVFSYFEYVGLRRLAGLSRPLFAHARAGRPALQRIDRPPVV